MANLRINDDLYQTYKELLRGIKSSVNDYIIKYDELSFSKRLEAERQLNVAKEIEQQIVDKYADVNRNVKKFSTESAEMGYNGVWYSLEGAENLSLAMPAMTDKYVNALVNEKVDGQIFSQRLYTNRDKLAKRTTAELLQGLAHGKGYPEIAKRISELTEDDYKKALRIAKTEGGRTQSHATQKSYEDANDLGVKMEKQWMATLDKKTRIAHQDLDGQRVGVKEQFKYEGNVADGPRLFHNAGLDINCRCTTIAIVNGVAPELRRDSLEKENIPFQSYNDWAEAKGFKPKTEKPKATAAKTDWNAILGKTNMKAMVGEDNYNNFISDLSQQKDPRVNKLFDKFGSELNFAKISNRTDAYCSGATVHLTQECFDGRKISNPLQTVYHEIGHGIDSRAAEVLRARDPAKMKIKKIFKKKLKRGGTTEFEREVSVQKATGSPDYSLGDTIKRDLWEYVNGKDLKMYQDLGLKPRKKAEKLLWQEEEDHIYETSESNFRNFISGFKDKYKDNKHALYDFSDIVEGTQFNPQVYHSPFGSGHGADYWKNEGSLETEFMAHMFEAFTTSPDSREVFEEVMPNAVKKWQQLMDDVLKED